MTIATLNRHDPAQKALPVDLANGILLLTLISSYAVLALQPELRMAVPLLVGATAIMTMALAAIYYCTKRGRHSWSPATIIVVALLLRLMFLCAPPQLSDDIYRYLWDGGSLLRGTNPYAAPPSAVQPPPGLVDVYSHINHPRYFTIYPPAAQVVFAGGAALGGGVTGLKAFLVLIDMGLCALLVLLLKRLELPAWHALLYAWNPLPVIEIAGSGHVDGAGLALLAGAFWLLVKDRADAAASMPRRWPFLLSGALLAGAGLVKLFPFVLAPVLFLLVPAGRRPHFVAGFLGALAALIAAFLPHLVNMAASLDIYARNWEFAGFLFNLLRAMTGSGTVARLLLSTGFLLAAATVVFRLARGMKNETSPAGNGHAAMKACYAIATALLLLTPTLQPWYALCLTMFLPFCAGPAGLVLCWAVFLTYRVQIPYFMLGEWIESPWVTATVFLAPVTAWLMGRIVKLMTKNAARPV